MRRPYTISPLPHNLRFFHSTELFLILKQLLSIGRFLSYNLMS